MEKEKNKEKQSKTQDDKTQKCDQKEQQTSDQNKQKQSTQEEQLEPVDNELTMLLEEKEQKLESLNKTVAELKDARLRQLAEFDNFRKRTQKEKEDLYQSAVADCTLLLLPVLDNLERAVDTTCEQTDLKSGVQMTLAQLKEALGKLGVREIKAQGEEFDPKSHNAVQTTEDKELGTNTVCQVLQKGYAIGDKVLRHAMVVVANP